MLSKLRKKKLEQNIWKFYLYRVFCSFIFIMPVWVLFLQENGLSMTQIMIIQSIYTAVIMIAIVPAGIVADYIGRKKVIAANAVFYTGGWLIYASGHSFMQFLFAEIALALSSAMWFSSKNAFFYDTLRELGKEGSFKKLYGRVIGINEISAGLGSLVAGFIATHSLRLPFWLTFIITAFGLFIALSFTDTKKYKHGDTRYFQHLKDAASFTVKHPKVRLFIIYSAIFWAIISVAFVFYQPYLTELKIPLAYFGVVYAALSGATVIGARYAHKIEEKLGEKKILILIALAMLAGFLGMSQVFIPLGILFTLLISFSSGIFDPVITDYIQKHVESYHRATVSSLGSLVTQGTSAVFAPFFGWIFDVYSLQAALTVAAFIMTVNIFILSLMYVIGWRRLRNGENELV